MAPSIAVLSCLRDPGDALRALVASLDRQTLPYRDFEVALADLGSTDGSAQRLAQLAARRPNVSLTTVAGGSAQAGPARSEVEVLAELAAHTGADYLLVLPGAESLMPQALERLAALASSSGADVVVGRRVTPSRGSGQLLDIEPDRTTNPGPLGADLVPAATGGAVLTRREVLIEALAQAAPGTSPALVLARILVDGRSVVILPGYACLRGTGPVVREDQVEEFLGVLAEAGAEPERLDAGRIALTTPGTRSGVSVQLTDPGLSWSGSTLRITLSGVVVLPDEKPIELIPIVLLHDPRTSEEFPLLTSGSGAPTSDPHRLALSAEAELSPASAALGANLPDGPWQLKLRLFGAHLDVMVNLPATEPAPALLDGRPIGLAGAGGGLRFDAGAGTLGLVGALRATDARVTDTGSGNLLSVALPRVHGHGEGKLDGHLFQDKFAVPGAVVVSDGRAELQCFVGSLGGRYPLSARFGGTGPKPTGLDMEVSGVGAISVVPHRDPDPTPTASAPKTAAAPKPTTAPKPATEKSRASAKRPPRGPVQRLRRAVPAPLEPAAARLSKLPAARWAYRKLINR